MTAPVKIAGKILHAETCTADDWFDAIDLDKKRAQDYKLISICIFDKDGHSVYSPKDVGKLSVTDYAKLYEITVKVNRPDDVEKK